MFRVNDTILSKYGPITLTKEDISDYGSAIYVLIAGPVCTFIANGFSLTRMRP